MLDPTRSFAVQAAPPAPIRTRLNPLLAASGVNLNLSTVDFASFSSSVTAAVPEPSTYALMALGLGAVSVVMPPVRGSVISAVWRVVMVSFLSSRARCPR